MASNTIVLITGANTGLGFETVKALCQSSKAYTILLGGRDLEKANAAAQEAKKLFPESPSNITAVKLDIEDDNSILQAFEHVSSYFGHLDVLINNAGAQFDQQLASGEMTMREVWNKSWNLNTTGTHIVTHTFVPLLLKSTSPRLLFITSGTSSMAENGNTPWAVDKSPAKGWPKDLFAITAYRSSKAGMNMMMREWTRILKEDGVKIWCISPGFLATGLGGGQEFNRKMGAVDPSTGANFVRDVVEGGRDQDVGRAIRRTDVQPW